MKFLRLGVVCLLLPVCLLGQERSIFIPQQYEDALGGKKVINDLKFYVFPFTSEKVDLRALNRKYPSTELPKQVVINVPFYDELDDAYLFMALIDEEVGAENNLVIWIAANYNSDEVTLYVDENMDHNYEITNPYIIKRGDDVYDIKIYPSGTSANQIDLQLNIPESNIEGLLKTMKTNSFKSKMWHNWVIGITADIGVAKLRHEYNNFETGFPAWYTVSLMEKEVGLTMNYYWPNLRFAAGASYQNIYQYTSYFHTRLDEPMIITSGNQRVRRENVSTEINKDVHSINRFAFDVLGAYRLHVNSTSELQFIFGGGKILYMSGEYVANKHEIPMDSYSHSSDNFIKGGVQFEFAVGRRKTASFGILYRKTWWNPEGYFESFNGSDLTVNYSTINFHFGYSIAL